MNDQMWRAFERRFWELASELDEIKRAYVAWKIDLEEVVTRCETVFAAIEELDKAIALQLPVEVEPRRFTLAKHVGE